MTRKHRYLKNERAGDFDCGKIFGGDSWRELSLCRKNKTPTNWYLISSRVYNERFSLVHVKLNLKEYLDCTRVCSVKMKAPLLRFVWCAGPLIGRAIFILFSLFVSLSDALYVTFDSKFQN